MLPVIVLATKSPLASLETIAPGTLALEALEETTTEDPVKVVLMPFDPDIADT
jgi:hypothetical protein